jgi:hypothetical protein
MSKIEEGKKYRLRQSGLGEVLAVRVLSAPEGVDVEQPVMALISSMCCSSNPIWEAYTAEGLYYSSFTESEYDLVEVSPYEDFVLDERVLVKDTMDPEWHRRYFAGVSEDGKPLAWGVGTTSWSTGEDKPTRWDQCKRAE